jgi:hypothetical protein
MNIRREITFLNGVRDGNESKGGFGLTGKRGNVERKRGRMKKLNCLSIQEKESTKLIYREKTILGKAEYHNRSPKPSTSAEPVFSTWWQARPMGASEAGGGRRGQWGP